MIEDRSHAIIWTILLIYAMVNILFVIAQSRFIDSMRIQDQSKQIKKIWVWTQLIPLWGYLAFMVTLFKIETQFKTYLIETFNENNQDIKQYSTTWGIVYIIGVSLSKVFSLFIILAPIGYIAYWLHINEVKKSLLTIHNDNKP